MSTTILATELVINFLESEHITANNSEIMNLVYKWNSKLAPIDFISLAAVVISNPNKIALTKSEIREIRNFYFPSKKSY